MLFKPELPALDDARCTGCGDCRSVCSVDCLEMGDRLPYLCRPEDCLACAICINVCPSDALVLASVDRS